MDVKNLERAVANRDIEPLRAYLDADGDVDVVLRDTGWTLLHECVKCSFVEAIDLLMDYGVTLNCVDMRGKTPLAVAASNGSHSIVGLFLQYGAAIESSFRFWVLPLLLAARRGCLETTSILIDAGASIFAVDEFGNTSLLFAAYSRRGEVIDFLVSRGAMADACDIVGESALMALTSSNEIYKVKRLLESGVEIDTCDRSGRSAFAIACQEGYDEIAMHLVSQGTDVNKLSGAGWSPLFMTLWNGFWPLAHTLFDHGAQIEAPYKDQLILLHSLARLGAIDYIKALLMGPLARLKLCSNYGQKILLEGIHWGHDEAVDFLLARGAPLHELEAVDTPLGYAIMRGNRNAVKILLMHGAEVGHPTDTRLSNGWDSCLANAIMCNNENITLDLIEEGAMIDEVAYPEKQPNDIFLSGPSLHLAAFLGVEGLMSTLCKQEIATSIRVNEVTPLHLAAANGHAQAVITLLRHGAPIDAKCSQNVTPLHWAATGGWSKVVAMLCDQGSEVNLLDSDGRTPLFCAVEQCRPLTASTLLGFGADASTFGRYELWDGLFVYGITPLCCAAHQGDLRMIKILLRHECKVNEKDKAGYAPMDYAASMGHTKAMRLLYYRGGDVSRESLRLACKWGHLKAVEFVLQKMRDNQRIELELWKNGFNGNEPSGEYPIFSAAIYGREAARIRIIELLLRNGFSLDQAERFHVLHGAAGVGHEEVVRFFLSCGAGIDKPDVNDESPLHSTSRTRLSENARVLLELGADREDRNMDGCTPLISAVNDEEELSVFDDSRPIDFLIGFDADVASRDNANWSALHYSAHYGRLENLGTLLRAGSAIDAQSIARETPVDAQSIAGETPLHLAALKGWTACVAELTLQGTDLERVDEYGNTALLLAAREGHKNVVSTLLGHGADSNSTNLNGWSVLHEATIRGHAKVVALLLRHAADVNKEICNDNTSLQRRGSTAINIACLWASSSNTRVLENIAIHGSFIDGLRGHTPLHTAVFFGRPEALQFLLEGGSTIEASRVFQCTQGASALHLACALPSSFHTKQNELIDILFKHGCDVNVRMVEGWTPLQICCSQSYVPRVSKILTYGGWIDDPGTEGFTPVCSAAGSGHVEMVKMLIENGADENFVSYRGTDALFYASQNGHLEVMHFLLSRSRLGDPDLVEKQSWIIAAARNGHLDILNILLRNYAREGFEVDKEELRHAWQVARRYGHEDVVVALEAVFSPYDEIAFGYDLSHVQKMHYGVNLIETIAEAEQPMFENHMDVSSSMLGLLCW